MLSIKSKGSVRAVTVAIVAALGVFVAPLSAQAATDVSSVAQLEAALSSGGEFNITADISSANGLTIPAGKEVTLSSSGDKTITMAPTKTFVVLGKLNLGNGLTIRGSQVDGVVFASGVNAAFNMSGGVVTTTTGALDKYAVLIKNKARATISGGTINALPTAANSPARAVFFDNASDSVISGGTFNAIPQNSHAFALMVNNSTVRIAGGVFNAPSPPGTIQGILLFFTAKVYFDTTAGQLIDNKHGVYSWGNIPISSNVQLPAGFSPNTGSTILDGLDPSVTLDAATSANLNATLVDGTAGKKAIKLDGAPGEQGSVILNAPKDSQLIFVVKIADASVTVQNTLTGKDRVETAILTANQPALAAAKEAVIVNGGSPIDGVIAAPLAIQKKAPILYGTATGLGNPTSNYIKAKGITKVTLVGQGKVTEAEKAALPGVTFEQLAGNTRYDTAVKVAALVPGATKAYVADGRDIVDPMVAAVAAGKNNGVVLLCNGNNAAPQTTDYIAAKSLTITAVGSWAVNAHPTAASKIDGATRYETAFGLAKTYVTKPNMPVFATSGVGLVDAVPSAVLASLSDGAMIYVKPGQSIADAVDILKTTTGQNPGPVTYIGIIR